MNNTCEVFPGLLMAQRKADNFNEVRFILNKYYII